MRSRAISPRPDVRPRPRFRRRQLHIIIAVGLGPGVFWFLISTDVEAMILIDLFPKSHLRYQESPASSWLADFADWLERSGYTHSSTHRHVRRLWHILEACGSVAPDAIFSAPELAAMFTSPWRQSEFRCTQRAFESFLIDSGRFITEPDRRRFSQLLNGYRLYLIEVRGLVPATIGQHIKTADAFLTHAVPDGVSLRPLSATAVERFVTAAGQRVKRQSLQHTVARLRAFLRFCYSHDELCERLDCIDTRIADPRVEVP